MTKDQLRQTFDKHCDEYLQFHRVADKHSKRPDLHAFILLDSLAPSAGDYTTRGEDIVSAANHDEIYLSIDLENLAQVITEQQVIELIRCGVRIEEDSLQMFI